MLRSPWFWTVIVLIALCTALATALGVLHWLVIALEISGMLILVTFLFAAYVTGYAKPPKLPHLQALSTSERLPVVYDCDITIGRLFRDVDDGLVLLYLLGEPRVNLLGITTTYGNGPIEMTTHTARRLLKSTRHDDVVVRRGAAGPDDAAETNEAARYLQDITAKRPGEIILIATGSMTNLKHAAMLNPEFFKKLRGIYMMGGVIEPLIWNGRRLAELNFTLDPEAAYQTIHAACPVTIAPGQAGITAVFRSPQFAALQAIGGATPRHISSQIRSWFALMRLYFHDGGFALWGSAAALMLTHPGLFEYERVHVTSTRDDLRFGRLVVDQDRRGPIRLVRNVHDYESFITAHFAAWHHLDSTRRTP